MDALGLCSFGCGEVLSRSVVVPRAWEFEVQWLSRASEVRGLLQWWHEECIEELSHLRRVGPELLDAVGRMAGCAQLKQTAEADGFVSQGRDLVGAGQDLSGGDDVCQAGEESEVAFHFCRELVVLDSGLRVEEPQLLGGVVSSRIVRVRALDDVQLHREAFGLSRFWAAWRT